MQPPHHSNGYPGLSARYHPVTFVGRFKPIVTLLTCLARWRICHQKMVRLQAFAEDLGHRIFLALSTHVFIFLQPKASHACQRSPCSSVHGCSSGSSRRLTLSFDQLCALFVLTNLVNLFTVVPGGLGWFETCMVGYASAVGLGDDKGVAFALVSRMADVILLTIGSCLILHYGLSHVVRGQAGERVSTEAGQTHREVPESKTER